MRYLLLLGLWACAEGRGPTPDGGRPPVPVVAVTVEERDVPIYLDGLGTVNAFRTIAVHTQVDGQLQEVHFREGQEVRRGDLLAQIDPRPFIAQLHQAESALERDKALYQSARANLRRLVNLRGRHLVAQQNVDDQEALVGQYLGATRVDKAQIETARLNLKYARITSPVDGVTGIRLIDPGNVVHAADANGIVVLTQLDPIAVVFTLPQDELLQVARELRKQPLPVQFFSRDGKTVLGSGKVALIDNQINLTTATLRIKAVAPNPERLLWPNQFVKAHLHVSTRMDALVVPSQVVQRGPAGDFVYVIGHDDIVSVRAVSVELVQGELTLIKSGLRRGEQVVQEGQDQLSPGAKIVRRQAEARAP